jgi:aspartate/methionine/tyrosine aminotransferase
VENISMKDLRIDVNSLDISGEHDGYGFHPLIESIALKYRTSSDSILLTQGASHAIFVVCAALIEKGEVIVEKPVYGPLVDVPRALGARIEFIERDFTDNYRFKSGKTSSQVSSNTQLILLTNPHNPSGVYLADSDLREIMDVSKKYNIPVVFDEIYLDFFNNSDERSFFGLSKNIIVISSLTKVYGLGGLRCGWIAAHPDLISVMKPLIDHTIVEGVFAGEQMSAQAFSQLGEIKAKKESRLAENIQVMRDFFKGEENLTWIEPPGGVICFPKIEADITGNDLAAVLKDKYDTAIVPGSFFREPQHIRLGFDLERGLLDKALGNIKDALSKSG